MANRRIPFRSVAVVVGLLASASILGAQQIPADPVLQGFEPTGLYVLVLDGEVQPDAKLYEARKAGSVLLIESPELGDPVMITPRTKKVESIPAVKVVENEDGRLDVLSDAELVDQGEFRIDGAEVEFTIGGRQARLEERPYLLGLQFTREMLEHDPGYAWGAKSYKPSGPMVRSLSEVTTPVRVRVFFGSWCPHCKEMLPRVLSVAKELADSQVSFEYYGLPRPFDGEPEARRSNIHSVPTGVVYRDGREVGRIEGAEWRIPELALKRILD